MSERKFPWRTLLFVSVALNLLAVGAVAGALGAGVRLEREAPREAVTRMPGARAFMAALPPELRVKMRAALADGWVESRNARLEAREARRAAFEAAATEPYDAERVRAAFVRLRAADQTAIGVFHDQVIEAFATLTPEERRSALEALRRAPPAQRANVAPQDGAALESEAAPDALTPQERREQFRERLRERRRERLERQQQQQTP
jgi:uncharacterized membrane protein